ncbi:MAG: hypothetical protein V4616_07565 [Bacteroidota bacterium]
MTGLLSRLFLVVYLFAFVKPIIPLVHDMCSHAFAVREHFDEHRSGKGHDHLEKELKAANSENTNTSKQDNFKQDETRFVHLPVVYVFSLIKAIILPVEYSHEHSMRYFPPSLSNIAPPPRFS